MLMSSRGMKKQKVKGLLGSVKNWLKANNYKQTRPYM